jgi:hypothetical protein
MERRRRELAEPAERRALAGRRLMRGGFIVNSGWNGACPSAFINVMWMAIGLYGVFHGTRAHPTPAAQDLKSPQASVLCSDARAKNRCLWGFLREAVVPFAAQS